MLRTWWWCGMGRPGFAGQLIDLKETQAGEILVLECCAFDILQKSIGQAT
jgi:hypothetical protein